MPYLLLGYFQLCPFFEINCSRVIMISEKNVFELFYLAYFPADCVWPFFFFFKTGIFLRIIINII